jgi:hypothetical protein
LPDLNRPPFGGSFGRLKNLNGSLINLKNQIFDYPAISPALAIIDYCFQSMFRQLAAFWQPSDILLAAYWQLSGSLLGRPAEKVSLPRLSFSAAESMSGLNPSPDSFQIEFKPILTGTRLEISP